MADKKEKKYVSDNARLMSEWDFTQNDALKLDPHNLSINSNISVWWICSKCGNRFLSTIRSRKKSEECKKCSLISRSKKWLEQRGSFADKHPELVKEWHPLNNGDLTPNQILVDSPKKVWWICSKGHEWQASPNNRNHGKGCPVCANQLVWGGYNDLKSQNPSLAKQWHPYLNGDTKPSDVIVTSNKKAWWICENGHEWEAIISDRSRIGLGCPYCSNQKLLKGHNDLASVNPDLAREWHPTKNKPLTPDMVQVGSNSKAWWICEKGHEWNARIAHRNKGVGCPHCAKELNTSFPEQTIFYYFNKTTNTENRYRFNGNYEIDIYLPQYKIGIEYDGVYFHSKKRAKELERKKEKALHDAGITLIRVKETENLNDCIDTECVFYYLYSSNSKHLGPVIRRLLNRVSEITGKEFYTDVDIERDRSDIYELYIEREKQNSLLALRPALAAEWHPSKNGRLKSDMVSLFSNKVVWWQCEHGHEWQAPINRRSGGIGCPICSNKKVLSGYNDLQTRYPDVAAQWHPTKNKGKLPTDVLPFSNKKAWWICEKGHEWQATINSRSSGKGCPHCKGMLGGQKRIVNLIAKQGSLASKMPMLAAEWHPSKNGELQPSDVTIGSGKKAWWICNSCGHEWEAVIGSRSKGAGCPKCAKRKNK